MTTPMTASALGTLPYDDVYLDQISTDEEDDDEIDANVNISLKPLMSPRKRPKVAMRMPRGPTVWQVRQQKRCLKAFYVVMMMSVISLVTFVLFRITHDYHVSMETNKGEEFYVTVLPNGTTIKQKQPPKIEVLPCMHYDVEDVWIKNLPMYQTESAFRLVDVNKDGTLDVIMGFSTAANGYFIDENLLCAIYFNGHKPCFGGVIAIDGASGDTIWTHDTPQEIFAVNCNVDIDSDGVRDCLCAGRMGLFRLISGGTGDAIWSFDDNEILESVSNLYTAQFVQDMNGDGVQDVLNIHGGDPFRAPGTPVKHIGKLVLFSGRDGHVISFVEVPERVESYYSPQVYYRKGGQPMVLFGSGGETQGGSLWVMPLHDILEKTTQNAKVLYTDKFKGVMIPPVLLDLTGDHVEDIVMTMFNSTIVAFNGETYKQLWNHSVPGSESYSTPAAGFYNDDDVPDFLINNHIGPGYPIYYNSEVTIINGRNGEPLLPSAIKSAGSAQSSGLTISTEGQGNDAFIYFNLDCLDHEGEGGEYKILETDKEGKAGMSRVDFCKHRYNTETYTRLFALNQHMETPGQSLYNSMKRKSVEYQHRVNSSLLAKAYLDEHPEVLKIMLREALKRQHSDEAEDLKKEIGIEEEDTEKDEELGLPYRARPFLGGSPYQATTGMPTYTQELFGPISLPNLEKPISGILDEDTGPSNDETEEVDDSKYNALLEKLQSFFKEVGVHEADNPLREEGEEEEEVGPVSGFRDFADVPSPQKRPQYGEQDWPNRYNPAPENRYTSPAANDYDDYNTKQQFYKLLTKYPWLLQELYNDNSQQPLTPAYYPSKKRRPDAWLPRRQWGRESSSWSRRRRDTLTKEDNALQSHLRKMTSKQHRSLDKNLNPIKKVAENQKRTISERHWKKKNLNSLRKNRKTNSHNLPKNRQQKRTDNQLHGHLEQKSLHRNLHSRVNQHKRNGRTLQGQRHRSPRHAGLHDDGGTMRILSTGTLAPPLSGVDSTQSIDLVFATYWFYPNDKQIILPEEEKCLNDWVANETQRLIPGNPYYGQDHDAYEHESMEHCIKKDHQTFLAKAKMMQSMNPLDIYPFNIHAGEMSMYRLRLTCRCGLQEDGKNNPTKRCAKILPYKEQQWAGYMGTFGNSHFHQRKAP